MWLLQYNYNSYAIAIDPLDATVKYIIISKGQGLNLQVTY